MCGFDTFLMINLQKIRFNVCRKCQNSLRFYLLRIMIKVYFIIRFLQFSPTSEHILLAYGRRHGSLLKSIVIDGETTLPIYTVLEVNFHILSFC